MGPLCSACSRIVEPSAAPNFEGKADTTAAPPTAVRVKKLYGEMEVLEWQACEGVAGGD
jgi:hypothetical protein